MKTKLQKREELKSLKAKLPDVQITVFTSFAKKGQPGLSVAQMRTLKKSLRAVDSEYLVTKKTLIDLATQGLTDDKFDVYGMEGSMGLVLGKGDPYTAAKKLYEFAKANPAMDLLGAIFGGKFLTKDAFMEIAKLPSKEVLIGRLLGMLTYPVRGLAVALSQVAKQKTN